MRPVLWESLFEDTTRLGDRRPGIAFWPLLLIRPRCGRMLAEHYGKCAATLLAYLTDQFPLHWIHRVV